MISPCYKRALKGHEKLHSFLTSYKPTEFSRLQTKFALQMNVQVPESRDIFKANVCNNLLNVFLWTAYDAIFNLKVIQLLIFFSFCGSQVFVLQTRVFCGLIFQLIFGFTPYCIGFFVSFLFCSVILHLSSMVNEHEYSIVSLISNLLSHLHPCVLVVCVKQVSLWSQCRFPISQGHG